MRTGSLAGAPTIAAAGCGTPPDYVAPEHAFAIMVDAHGGNAVVGIECFVDDKPNTDTSAVLSAEERHCLDALATWPLG